MDGQDGGNLHQSIEEAIEHLARFLSEFDNDPAPVGWITPKVHEATFCETMDDPLGVSLRRA
jgi:hypothetical protein